MSTDWGWSPGAQETGEFNILAQYYSAYLGIAFERFERFVARPWERRRPFWEITLVDYDPHYSEYDPEYGRRRTVMEIPR